MMSTPSSSRISAGLATLLDSGDIPVEQEAKECRAALSTSIDELCVLEGDIKDAVATLDGLLARHDNIQTDIVKLRSLVHPIRRLPHEILSEIFMASIEATVAEKSDGGGTVPTMADIKSSLDVLADPRWSIIRVSRRWRAVALGFPRLWSIISLKLQTICDFDRLKQAQLQFLLQYSGRTPLVVTLAISTPLTGVHRKHWLRDGRLLVTLLTAESARWKLLTLLSDPSELESQFLLATLEGNLPNLEKLSILHDKLPFSRVNLSFFKSCPKLTAFSCRSVTSHIELPWSQITNFFRCVNNHVDRFSASEALDILHLMPNLRRCALLQCNSSRNHPSTTPLRYVTLKDLVYLDLRTYGEAGTQFVNSLHTPALRTLKVRGDLTIDTLLDFQSRCSFSLGTLAVSSRTMTRDECTKLVTTWNTLSYLTLDCPSVTRDDPIPLLLRVFETHNPSRRVMLGTNRLRSIILRGCGDVQGKVDALYELFPDCTVQVVLSRRSLLSSRKDSQPTETPSQTTAAGSQLDADTINAADLIANSFAG